MRPITKIIVHCTATRCNQTAGVGKVNEWHRDRGFPASPSGVYCGYHYIIRRTGKLETGREEDEIGVHCQGYNTDSLGVCLEGGVAEDARLPENNFTRAQFQTLKTLLLRLDRDYPGSKLYGHKDLNARKACPSFDVCDWAEKEGLFL